MRNIFICFLTVWLQLSVYQAYCQTPAFYDMDVNNIKARITAVGHHFWDFAGSAHFEVPKDSGKCTIFTNTLWIGGADINNNLYLSAERYRQIGADYTTGPLTTDGSASTDSFTINSWNRLWVIDKSMIEQHIQCISSPASCPGYIIPNEILSWPTHGNTALGQSPVLAPFADVNNDGHYTPSSGDYPLIRGDRAVFFVFNDSGIPNTESGGVPLGVEVHAMVYAFDCPQNTAFNHTLFMNYKIYNRSNRNYHNTFAGLFTDFDIGAHLDDYIGCDVARGSFFGYNGKPIDGDGASFHYGACPPAQALTILAGPLSDPDGIDNPRYDSLGNPLCNESINGFNFGDGIIDNERLGLSRFIYFNNTTAGAPPYMHDPDVAADYYNYLNGKWKDSTVMLYGGNAHITSGAYGPACKFMFPGDSDPCNWGTGGQTPNGPVYWDEVTAGNQPNDRRGLGSVGPFTLNAGQMQEIDFAFVYGRTSDSLISSVDVMKAHIDEVRNAFFSNQSPCGGPIYAETESPLLYSDATLLLYPNPAQNELYVKFNSDKPQPVRICIYDVLGRHIVTRQTDSDKQGSHMVNIDTGYLPAGLYTVILYKGPDVITKKLIIER